MNSESPHLDGADDLDRSPVDDAISHLDLLGLASTLRRTAMQGKAEIIGAELAHLRRALSSHVCGERHAVVQLAPVARRAVEEGQRTLLSLVDELLNDALAGGTECSRLDRSAGLIRHLVRQARLEAGILGAAHPGTPE